jgi:hypothetical protein
MKEINEKKVKNEKLYLQLWFTIYYVEYCVYIINIYYVYSCLGNKFQKKYMRIYIFEDVR